MVNFCNPQLLGTISQFRKTYQNPILIGREPDATDSEMAKSESRRVALSDLVNEFILRRTNTILSEHLPPKLTQIVFVRMTPLQREIYAHILSSKAVQAELGAPHGGGGGGGDGGDSPGPAAGGKKSNSGKTVLSSITSLKKLCNHPQLLYVPPSFYREAAGTTGKSRPKSTEINKFFPDDFGERKGGGGNGRRGRGAAKVAKSGGIGRSFFEANVDCELRLRTFRQRRKR